MKYQAFTVFERDGHVPLLPVELLTADNKADTLGLDDLNELDIFAQVLGTKVFGQKLMAGKRNGGALKLAVSSLGNDDIQDLLCIDVYIERWRMCIIITIFPFLFH